ncbi:MAG: P-II family nitrogen regulator, partial [bacterium]
VAVIAWVAVTMAVVFSVIKATVGLRVDREEEIVGLDIKEHGIVTEFNEFDLSGLEQSSAAKEAVTVEYVNTTANDVNTAAGDKMTKLTIVTRKSKFDALKAALNKIGVTGMTVMEVMGCGQQKGNSEFYRGVELEVHLIPKVQVDVVVCEVSPRLVIETAKKVLATGKIGDGKIFVYNVENVVKIRTGEEGLSALCNNK